MPTDTGFQRSFARYHARGLLDDPARFSGWVARIAINRARTRVRQLARLKETPSGTREMLDQVASHDVWAWQYDLVWLLGREALQGALDGLPGDCRASVFCGLSRDVPSSRWESDSVCLKRWRPGGFDGRVSRYARTRPSQHRPPFHSRSPFGCSGRRPRRSTGNAWTPPRKSRHGVYARRGAILDLP